MQPERVERSAPSRTDADPAPARSIDSPSRLSNPRAALIMPSEPGFIIAASSPASIAALRKLIFTVSRSGRPKEMFETPRDVLTPSFSFISLSAPRVFSAACGSAPRVRVSGSTIILSRPMPIDSARATILSAMTSLPSGVSGIPFPSSVSAIRTPPYLFASGSRRDIDSSLPFTELMSGIPLYCLSAASIASGEAVSI